MSEKTREICTVVSQESIGAGIYSMWIQTDRIAADAKPGQFVSLYTNDKSKILPRPISLCEIDKENGRLHLVYRVTGQGTGTDEFSQMKAGDTIPVLGPLGNGFPVEKAEGKKVFLMGGGIGVPPILELAKQMKCEKKQIIAGYRDCHTFLREEFEAAGTLYIATEDGSVGTKGNVMDAIRENALEADVIYACGPTPMLRAIKKYAEENGITTFPPKAMFSVEVIRNVITTSNTPYIMAFFFDIIRLHLLYIVLCILYYKLLFLLLLSFLLI